MTTTRQLGVVVVTTAVVQLLIYHDVGVCGIVNNI